MNNHTTVAIAAEMVVDVQAAGHVTLVPIARVSHDPARPAGQGSKAAPLHRGVCARDPRIRYRLLRRANVLMVKAAKWENETLALRRK